MAGVKGKSGGPRPNSGGTRAGAGRKPNPVPKLPETGDIAELLQHKDPKIFLMAVMNDAGSDARLRIDAAKALMPFVHLKLGEGGKKDQQQKQAEQASTGRFAAPAGPRLAVNNK